MDAMRRVPCRVCIADGKLAWGASVAGLTWHGMRMVVGVGETEGWVDMWEWVGRE